MKKRVLGIILGAMVTMAMSVTAFANENQSQELSVTLTAEHLIPLLFLHQLIWEMKEQL